jgi:signal transduction histidine kinase/ligand-binding sensor domain-containing protein
MLWFLACSAPAATTSSSWFARAWQTDEGLPNNTVESLALTGDGFLWVATPVGLARFDGVQFEELSLTNFVAEPNRGVLALVRSRSGGLWLAMDRGPIVGLNPSHPQVFTSTNGLPDRTAEKMAEDGSGAVWVAYRGGTLRRLADGKATLFGAAEGVPRGAVYSLISDNHGRIWLGAAQQVCVFRNGRFEHVLERTESPLQLASSRDGGVWICAGFRLLKWSEQGGLEDHGTFEPQRAGTEPTVMLEDSSGAVWIGTSYSGLERYDGSHFENVPTTHREILSLAEDRDGNLWVGTAGGGLNRIRVRAVQLEGLETGLPTESVQSLSEAPDGTIWATTQNGFLSYNSAGRWSTSSNSTGGLTCVAVDRAGAIWAGSRNRQLYCWQQGECSEFTRTQGLSSQILHSLLASSTGDLWIGGAPGVVQRLRAGRFENFKLPPDSGAVRAMVEDSTTNIWIGTARGLLLRIHGEETVDESKRWAGPRMSIRSLYPTADGSLWIGFAGWGLGRLKDGVLSRVTTSQGLHDDFISQIVDDEQGWLWCAGDHGIFKVRQRSLEELFEGSQPRFQSIHYGAGEGLPSLQATFGITPGALRARDGRLWIPMRTGLAVVEPRKLHPTLEVPSVLLTRVKVDGTTAAWYGGILSPAQEGTPAVLDLQNPEGKLRLKPGHRRLEFEFTALSLGAPDNVHFRYRMDEIDEGWSEALQRNASYSRLPAGTYRFEVTACNSDGVWNETGTALELNVAPFAWQTWWFRLAALALFTSAIIGIGRYVSFRRLRLRLQTLEQQAALDKERARIARDIHDDLGTRLSEITLLGALALQDRNEPEKAAAHVQQIASTVRQATDSMDEIVWAVNPGNDTLPHLIGYLGQFAREFLEMAQIECHLSLPEQPPKRPLTAEVRHNLFLVVKEALNNIVRHSGATEAWLAIKLNEDSMTLTIEDNGSGFVAQPEDACGNGLRNLHQRMSDVGGQCRVESKPGAGTKVCASYYWGNATRNGT